jgi:hypothetical protein
MWILYDSYACQESRMVYYFDSLITDTQRRHKPLRFIHICCMWSRPGVPQLLLDYKYIWKEKCEYFNCEMFSRGFKEINYGGQGLQ